MTLRPLNSPVEVQRGSFTYLYEIEHSGGTIRVTNATADIVTLGHTWSAVGGALLHGGAPETADMKAQGTELELWGVDQTIISAIQNNQFRGRLIKIYLLHVDPDTGVVDTPDLIFQGRQNSDYRVSENRTHDDVRSGGTVTVKTRISADLSAINNRRSVRCNLSSHQEMLRRAGFATPRDTFFERVPSLMNRNIFWGSPVPDSSEDNGVSGGGGDDRDDPLDGQR